jgi:hypothetical protein
VGQAGWFPDPTGRAEQRYWNGTAWTDHVVRGGAQITDPITGDYAPPTAWAAPVASAPWQATSMPSQPARQERPKWPWVLGGIFAAFVLGVGGCVAIVAVAVHNAVEHLNAEQRAHAISREQFDAVPLGTSQAAVIQMLGKQPEDTQEFVTKGVLKPGDINSSCIYYNKKGGSFGDRFQFCFEDDSLRSKNAY